MTLVAFGLLFAGFGTLAVSMPRHHQDLFRRQPARRLRWTLRGVGWLLLASAVLPAIADSGPSVGLVFWFGLATAAALAVAVLLAYRHAWQPR